jgi:hypothetical protein
VKRYATWAVIALLTYWAVQDPTAAAHLVRGIGAAFSHAASSLSQITSGS